MRTELLKALANAFGIKDGIAVANGKTTFTDKFMSRLEEILGPEFKRGDFGIKDGVVDSGKPLTQRRILEVNNAIEALGRENIFHPFQDSEIISRLENLAFENGYKKTDFGKLNMAANFLMKGLGMDSVTALGAVVAKGSPANRAMNAGAPRTTARRLSTSPTGRMLTSTGFTGRLSNEAIAKPGRAA